MPPSQNTAKLLNILRDQGLVSSQQLVKALKINRTTLWRKLKGASPDLIQIGKTRNLKFGLLRHIEGLDNEQPLFRIDETGQIHPIGKLIILHNNIYVVEPHAQVFEAPPPEVFDMAPQGFMGRGFAVKYAQQLNIPTRLQDWSDDHVLKAVSKFGEDLAGNLIIGKDSAKRWQKINFKNTTPNTLKNLVHLALIDQPAGSSAGGERPKFSILHNNKHKIVKFAGPLDKADQKRWRDLLICEHLALKTLSKNGILASKTEIIDQDNYTFLMITRFDRIGKKGRRPTLTLAAINDYLFGNRDNWSQSALRLKRSGFIDQKTSRHIRFIETFSKLIGDTDRHFHNISLYPKFSSPKLLKPESFDLAPVFDKLPMIFAPIDGQVVDRKFTPQTLPDAENIDVWNDAQTLAKEYWKKITTENSISASFRKIAKLLI